MIRDLTATILHLTVELAPEAADLPPMTQVHPRNTTTIINPYYPAMPVVCCVLCVAGWVVCGLVGGALVSSYLPLVVGGWGRFLG